MIQFVSIDAVSVEASGTRLLNAAARASTGGTTGAAALSDTSGLPPAYQGRASGLAARMPKGRYASDAFVAVGLELQKRAGIAAAEDAQRLNYRSPFGRPLSLATSKELNFWNKATREAAAKKPGRYFDAANKILGLTDKKAVPPPAGAGGCKGIAQADVKAIAEAGAKVKRKPGAVAKADKNYKMLVHQYKAAGKPIPSLSDEELRVFAGLMAYAQAGGQCSVSLGNGVEAKMLAVAKAVAKAGAGASITKNGVRAELVLDLSAKLEANASVGNKHVKVTASGAVVAGAKLVAKADFGVKDYKLHGDVTAGLAVAIGLEGSVNFEVDLAWLLEEDELPPRAVGQPDAKGVLQIKPVVR